MALSNYHLFVGRYDRGLMASDANHFEIKLNTAGDFYRIAVNVRSQDGSMLMTSRQEFKINNITVKANSTAEIKITANSNFNLGNNGGTISLLNPQGIKISGVQYTKEQGKVEGRMIRF